jgi:general secretion pathway protein D
MTSRPRPRSVALPIALALLLSGCATSHALKLARLADQQQDYDVAVAQYTAAVKQHPDSREAQLGLERAKLRASDWHLFRGKRLFAQGKYQDAMVELEIAAELNPTNADADRQLQAVRAALRTKLATPEGGPTPLQALLARGRDLPPAGFELPAVKLATQITTGAQATTRDLYLMIGQLAHLSVTFDSAFRDAPAQVSLLSNTSVKEALDLVAESTGTFYQVTAPDAIIVVPDTPAKRRDYQQEVVKAFYLQNADLKETIDALRVVGDFRSISQITGTNAILVRDTPERVAAIGRFLSAFDKARPEVVVDVEVLEVDRSKLLEYGAQFASPGSAGIDGSADANSSTLTLQSLRSLGQANVMIANIPALYYRLLKDDTDTRTLANPHIRILDGTTASANFGEEVPVPVTTLTPIIQSGTNIQPQTTFQYRTIGVNLGITPRTHPDDDVTLNLNIELSSLAGTGFGGIPTFGQRSVTTQIRLQDGETNILAGLIRDDQRTEKQTIPGLGDIPILGKLFAKNHTDTEQTDVVVMLTPHIIRTLDLTEDDLRPLRLPREGSLSSLMEPAPIVPAPPIRGGGGGGAPVSARRVEPPVPQVDLPPLPVSAGAPAGVPLPLAPLSPPAGNLIKN